MNRQKAFATEAAFVVFIANAVLLALVYLIGATALKTVWLTFLGLGLIISGSLWYLIVQLGKKYVSGDEKSPEADLPKAGAEPVRPQLAPSAAAVQLLSLLQRKGRLIDFLRENLDGFDDAQIGAAVRSVHEGCRETLDRHFRIEPIYAETEGEAVTVAPGFDARSVRLIGDVTGEPPFRGRLRHRGWRMSAVDLPALMPDQNDSNVIAAAEVEVSS